MTRIVSCGVALLSLLLAGSCAQVLGIGNPDTCTDGTTYCDGVCVDTLVDPENCGPRDKPEVACGHSCKGASCVAGACVDSDCSQEFVNCAAPASASELCHGLDCIEFAAATSPVCLRRCRSNDECPYNYFCAPKGENSYTQGFSQFVLVADHCVPSFCGGVNGTWDANGVANGGCNVGGDAYLKEGAVGTRPGTCIVASATAAGECRETGSVQTSGTCTFQPTGCVDRTAYHSCVSGDVCLATAGSATGTCYQVCDPKTSGQCPSGMTCRDHSGGARTLGACEY